MHEYAVDPEWLIKYLQMAVNCFGWDRRRLISKYPQDIRSIVTGKVPDGMDGKHVELLLNQLYFLKTKRKWRDDQTWLPNVLDANREDAFHAIVTESVLDSQPANLLSTNDLHDKHPLWHTPLSGKVERTTDGLVSVVAPLLYHSADLVLVDRFFTATTKYMEPLEAMLRAAKQGKKLTSVSYHVAADLIIRGQAVEINATDFQRDLDKWSKRIGLELEDQIMFYRWRLLDEGENLHPRYVLTARGGVAFDHGLDFGSGTTNWNWLSEQLWKDRREQYLPDSKAYTLVDRWKLTRFTCTRI
jgi:hypothetical protein